MNALLGASSRSVSSSDIDVSVFYMYNVLYVTPVTCTVCITWLTASVVSTISGNDDATQAGMLVFLKRVDPGPGLGLVVHR